jgi:glycerophosphoryl diester phosphodiesterase
VKSFPNERALSLLCEELQKKGIDCRNRFFPQVYGVGSDYEEVSKLGFPSIILTLYRTSITEQDLFRFVHDHQNIAAITIPAGKWTKTLTDALRTLGVRTYVHTINGKKESDRFLNQGVHGVYTDYDCHSQEMSRI